MTPEYWQPALARALIDAGADVIYGHHPHVIQPVQFYQSKPIFYSTGSFIFGTMSHVDPSTGIFQLTYQLENDAVSLRQLRVISFKTQGSFDFRPYELTDETERQAVFRKLVWKKVPKGFENPPTSFLQTGIVNLEKGRILNKEKSYLSAKSAKPFILF